MDSYSLKTQFVSVFAAAICFNFSLTRAEDYADTYSPALQVGESTQEYIQLAQLSPVPSAQRDTVYIQVPAPASRQKPAAADMDYLTERRDHFQRMQNTGFGLLMGGIGAGVGGLLLFITGINQMEENDGYDEYGNYENDNKGEGQAVIGYLAMVLVAPALITTGIILNRVGNHKRRRFQGEIDGTVGLDVGLNSMRLTYNF